MGDFDQNDENVVDEKLWGEDSDEDEDRIDEEKLKFEESSEVKGEALEDEKQISPRLRASKIGRKTLRLDQSSPPDPQALAERLALPLMLALPPTRDQTLVSSMPRSFAAHCHASFHIAPLFACNGRPPLNLHFFEVFVVLPSPIRLDVNYLDIRILLNIFAGAQVDRSSGKARKNFSLKDHHGGTITSWNLLTSRFTFTIRAPIGHPVQNRPLSLYLLLHTGLLLLQLFLACQLLGQMTIQRLL
ncbi:hypothetical protein PsorP6_008128 [Peronosclerospora sorghi]|uniref:Uncharacterized protein n=1 Tax=Peronosclerospora sorghi TaxID=230839 RepID=A0ACC0WBJ4_9STRA|nr:hypothetical protein PsorP6_008128 [Peronosclerospora sorghi]